MRRIFELVFNSNKETTSLFGNNVPRSLAIVAMYIEKERLLCDLNNDRRQNRKFPKMTEDYKKNLYGTKKEIPVYD